MWIAAAAYREYLATVTARVQAQDHALALAHTALHDANNQLQAAHGALYDLQERLLKAERSCAAAQAYADVWRIRIVSLEEREASLLKQLLPALQVTLPRIETTPTVLPGSGIDFDDMGDAAAALMSDADLHPVSAIHGVALYRDARELDEERLGPAPAGRL